MILLLLACVSAQTTEVTDTSVIAAESPVTDALVTSVPPEVTDTLINPVESQVTDTAMTPALPVIICNEFCNGCISEFSCTACVLGALQQPGSETCRDLCPMGSRPSFDFKTCEQTPQRIIHFDMASAVGQYLTDDQGYMVGIKGEYSSADKYDPQWLSKTGLEFRDEDFVQGMTPFVLGQSYTISAWINPTMFRDEMPIFAKTPNENMKEDEKED